MAMRLAVAVTSGAGVCVASAAAGGKVVVAEYVAMWTVGMLTFGLGNYPGKLSFVLK